MDPASASEGRPGPSPQARRLSGAYRLGRGLIRPPLMLLTRRDWRGGEHLPARGGFVAAANHVSHVDPLTFAHYLLDHGCPPRFLAKQSLFEVPVVGAVIRGAGQIPVRRETSDAARALDAAVEAVRAGECLGIYPEATLTRDPDLWPMRGKTGAARVALATGCPVVPVAQWGPQRILPPYSKRLNLFGRKTVHVWAGPPVDLADLVGDGTTEVGAPALEAATERIMDAITALLAQIRGEPAPAQRFDPRGHDLPRYGNPSRRRKR